MTSHLVLSAFPQLIPVGEVFIALIVRLLISYGLLSLAKYHLLKGRKTLTHDLQSNLHSHTGSLVFFIAGIEIILAGLLIIGLYTQVAALLTTILFLKILFLRKQFPHLGFESNRYYWLLCILSIALILTGSGGYFSFDYPL